MQNSNMENVESTKENDIIAKVRLVTDKEIIVSLFMRFRLAHFGLSVGLYFFLKGGLL